MKCPTCKKRLRYIEYDNETRWDRGNPITIAVNKIYQPCGCTVRVPIERQTT